MNFDLPELDPCGQVWFAVLVQSIEDLMSRSEASDMDLARGSARRWFKSPRSDVGSFRWVCMMVNLDPETVLERVREKLRDHPPARECLRLKSTASSVQRSDG